MTSGMAIWYEQLIILFRIIYLVLYFRLESKKELTREWTFRKMHKIGSSYDERIDV